MKKLLPLLLLLFPLFASAQEVIAVEDQLVTSNIVLSVVVGQPIPYSVQNYAITYTTTDAFGQPDTATGLLCVPTVDTLVYPLAVYNHGTVNSRDEVLSVEGNQERFVAQAIAGSGFITLAPDYLGLGGSDGIHPYFHAATEASAGRDMLIAARAWLDEQETPRNEQVFVTGYSQGGHASMALHRLLEESTEGPSVTAAAHLSGSYIVRPPSVQALAVSEPNAGTLRFFLNQVIAYETVYNLYGGIDQFFKEPYLTTVQRYIAEEIDLEELGIQIDMMIRENNAVVGDIFVDQYVTDVLDMDPALFAAYEENTVLDWAPEQPTLLFACPGDDIVNPANSQIAFDTMTALGSTTVTLTFGPEATHLDCVPFAAIAAVEFFQQQANVYSVSLGIPVERTDINLSPNPVTAGTEIRISGITGQRPFLIYDQSGRQLVNGQTTADGRLSVPTNVPVGLTVIRIGLEDGTSVVRRVIVR